MNQAGTAAPGLVGQPAPIVEAIRQARARHAVRFRVEFAITWLVLVGGLVLALFAAGKIDTSFLNKWMPFILGGVPMTILVSVVSIVFAVIFAMIGALGRLSSVAPIYAVATLYVSLVRGTPLIVQILFIYSALPQFGVVLDPFVAGVFALSFNYGAYMTEVFRAGIQAVPRGQTEAAQALGMPGRNIMQRIVMPQAIRIVIPAIGNEFIAMTKDSSLVSYVTLQELLYRARTVGSANFRSLETLLVAALMYWLITIVLSYFQARLERRMAESDVRI